MNHAKNRAMNRKCGSSPERITVRSTGRRRTHAFASARGNTLTEFAFILPLLVMVIFGLIDFGRALYTYHFVSDAAREASRWASVRGSQCDPGLLACPASQGDVQDYVAGIVPPGIDSSPQALSVTAAWVAPPGKVGTCNVFPNNPGCAVQVQVTYNFKFIVPFLPNSTYAMKSTSQMIISQ
jgi:Flp pilus assembly protein TadG